MPYRLMIFFQIQEPFFAKVFITWTAYFRCFGFTLTLIIHSNRVSLKAVLEGLYKPGVKKILHASDIVEYNPYQDETIDLF